jgi:site-specific recombinase XerD
MRGCRPFTDAEVDVLQRSFGGRYAARDKALFLVGVKTGFRITELLSLRVGDVCAYGQVVERVTVQRRYMKGELGKGKESRTVPLHPLARQALATWLAELQTWAPLTPQAVVFKSQKGLNRPMSRRHAWEILHDVVVTNELTGKIGTHAMRKTFAQHVYQQLNHDLVKTQRAMGHKNINSIVAYLSFVEEEIDAAILAS